MSIEQIIGNWKSDEANQDGDIPTNPIGEELSEQELGEISGSARCQITYCPLTLTNCFPFTD